jgi:hypothetical protein
MWVHKFNTRLKKLSKGGGCAVMIIDFMVKTYSDACSAIEKMRNIVIDIKYCNVPSHNREAGNER